MSLSISSSYGGPLHPGGLGTRTFGYPVSGYGNIGTEFGLRESPTQLDDLKRKLKMVSLEILSSVVPAPCYCSSCLIFTVFSFILLTCPEGA